MDQYTTADQLEYYPEGDYPGKKHSGWQRLGQVLSLGAYNPDNRALGHENEKITEAKTALKIQGAEAALKAEAARVEAAKNIQAFADNLVQFTGMDKVQALKLATEHYQEQSALAAQLAQNAVIEATKKGELPLASQVGAASMKDRLTATEANTETNEGIKRRRKTANTLGAPETEGLVDSTSAKKKLALEQGGLASTIRANDDATVQAALETPDMKQQFFGDQLKARNTGAANAAALAKMEGMRTTADAAGLAGDVQSGAYDANRRAALNRASTMILPEGAMAYRDGEPTIVNPRTITLIKNTDADGNEKVTGVHGVTPGYQGTADPVSQPIPAPADPGVIRIPRRSLLNPNAQ